MDDNEKQTQFLRPYVRRLLDSLLVLDADLDAYCIDYFPVVYKNFSNGMQRTQKLNLIILSCDLEDIVNNLMRHFPGRFEKSYELILKSMQPPEQTIDWKSKILSDIRGPFVLSGSPAKELIPAHPIDLFKSLKTQSSQLLATLPVAPDDRLLGMLPVNNGPVCYRISSGTFRASHIKIIENDCSANYTKHIIPGYSVSVQNDAQGNITIYASDRASILGSGAVRYNHGVLTAENLHCETQEESWRSRRIVLVEVTGNDQIQIDVTDYRVERTKNVLFSKKLPDCRIRFVAALRK